MNVFLFLMNLIFLAVLPFVMLGVIKKTKAFWGGRKGPGVFQPFFDFVKLLKKESVISPQTTFVFRIAPTVLFATTLAAACFVPLAGGFTLVDVDCAFILFSYILGFGKFFSIIAALDTGSSFEGMGASREACFSTLVEPAFFIIAGSVCIFTKNLGFESFSILNSFGHTFSLLIIPAAVAALFIMLLVECCRVPVDDPNTHLELTMIHEVMILDNSGVDLALITWSSAIKMFLYSALIINLLLPSVLPDGLNCLLFAISVLLIGVVVGTVESATARLRMLHVFEFVFIMTPIALVILAIAIIKMYRGLA